MMRRTWMTGLLSAAMIALAANAPARAGLLPVSVTVQPEAGNFRWTYAVKLPTNYELQSGDYFTVYDFAGLVPGSGGVLSPFPDDSAKAFWNFSTSKTGPTPALLSPTDDVNIDNLTWTYSGPTVAGEVTLGNFVATSIFQQSQATHFTGANYASKTGNVDNNITDTISPTGEVGPPPGVPEPATIALLGIGLPLVGGARWVRRKRK